MKAYPPAKVRNVALVGHGGSGKTTLTEALLLCSGAVTRAGRVEDGTTVSDFEPEEHSHHMSTSLTLAALEWRGLQGQRPGLPGLCRLRARDARRAVRGRPGRVRRERRRRRRGTDRDFLESGGRARDPPAHLHEQARPGTGRFLRRPPAVALRLRRRRRPSRAAHRRGSSTSTAWPTCSATPPLFTSRANAHATKAAIPDNMAAQEHTVRDSLVEGIVVADDDLMARYLDGEEITADELAKTLARGVVSSQVFPVICGSATKLVGIDRLARHHLRRGPLAPRAPAGAGAGARDQRRRGGRGRLRPGRHSPWPGSSRPSPTPTSGRYPSSRSFPGRSAPTPPCSTRGPRPKSGSTSSSPCGARNRYPSPRSPPATSAPWPSWPPRTPATP